MATRVGTHIGRYEIDAELGHGAMGVVYRGRDPRIDRTVAIKTISLSGLEPSAEQEYRARFVVEARAAGRLSHPGIVTIFDVGEPDAETPYLVMEHVEGQTLDNLLVGENNQLPLNTALRIAQELAEALHYAHEQGVVHRDIKPANVLVTTDGHVKITDFGIAKLNQAQLTVPGHVLGSPAYMAPEQLNEEGVDGRSDLFSMGVILYSMLTGHRPFQGNSATTVCFKLVNHDPLAVTAFNSQFPPEIDRIVSRAIAKDPDQRYQTGMELAHDIRKLREICGLIQKADWTARGLKRDAIPSYVAGAARWSRGKRPENMPATESAAELEQERSVQPTKSWLKWNGVLSSALFAAVVGIVTLSAINSRYSQRNQAQRTEAGAVTNRFIGVGDLNNQSTSVSQAPANGTLQIQIQHGFSEGRASVWLDNRLVYTHSLHGAAKSHALVFRRVEGRQSETIAVPTGEHKIRVRIQSAADHYDQSKTVDGGFRRDKQNILQIVCGKKGGELHLSFRPQSK
jgi:serine/threonine protein kinase